MHLKQESKRKFRRFDLPFGVKFRPTYGAKDYSMGRAVNLSCEGLALHVRDFRFILYENLEMIVGIPGKADPVSLFGDIMWKKQEGQSCLAGIKFRMKDKVLQQDSIEKIFHSSSIPAGNIYNDDKDDAAPAASENISVPGTPISDINFSGEFNKLGLVRHYHNGGARCAVTFRLLRDIAKNIRDVAIAGDFNNWDVSVSPMTRIANGDFIITIDLDSNREYRFRYLIDGRRWENDRYADKFVLNGLGFKDSVVIV